MASRLRVMGMRSRVRPGTTARGALWFVGMVLLLAGIVAMHGLNSHAGGMNPADHAIGMQGASTHAPAPGQVDLATSAAALVEPLTTVAAVVDESGQQSDLAGMCMAVLALAFTVLLRMLGRRCPLSVWEPASFLLRMPASQGRDPDPPSLIHLSIQRC